MIIKAAIALLLVIVVSGAYVRGRTHAFNFDNTPSASGGTYSPDSMMARLELKNIQMMIVELMMDNHLSSLPQGLEEPTNDMHAFPDPFTLPSDKGLTPWDGYGYVLYGHDKTSDHGEEVLEYYANVPTTLWSYTVDRDGTVHQHEGILGLP